MPTKSRAQPTAAAPVAEAETVVKEAVRRIELAVQEGLSQLRTQSKVYADVAGAQIEAAADKVSDEVRARPLAATGLALGVGVLLGFLLSAAANRK
jgi:ElaB/YqjD/DUF883 family membrane-anchored ribosome-binding protein